MTANPETQSKARLHTGAESAPISDGKNCHESTLPIPERLPLGAFEPPKPKIGRPSLYTPELAEHICQRIADGEGLVEICRDPEMPGRATVLRWLNERQDFQDRYSRARDEQADYYLDSLKEIADDGRNDWMERRQRDGTIERVLDREHVERSKIRVYATQWIMARLAPKKYGDRQMVEHSGSITVELGSRIDQALRYREQFEAIDVTPDTAATQSEPEPDATPALPAL